MVERWNIHLFFLLARSCRNEINEVVEERKRRVEFHESNHLNERKLSHEVTSGGDWPGGNKEAVSLSEIPGISYL